MGMSLVEMSDLPFQTLYDFIKIRGVGTGRYDMRFVLEGTNAQTAINDIALVCNEAKVKLNLKDVKFQAHDMGTSVNSDFTHLTLCKLTATGKTPTLPLRLYFTTSNDPNRPQNYYTGEIYYTKNGDIGKYAINKWKVAKGVTVDRTQYNGRFDNTKNGRNRFV